MKSPFAVWITGLPASGKSTVAAALRAELADQGIRAVVLESDRLREILTPEPRFDEGERNRFYAALVALGDLILKQGLPVVFDATANLRRYRDGARAAFPRFVEVYVDTPLDVCRARDPKGIYREARAGGYVPGLQAPYEPPERPDVVLRGDSEKPEEGARRIMAFLETGDYL